MAIIRFISKIFTLLFLLLGCNTEEKSQNIGTSFLPKAAGENSEMLIVMDSATFQRGVGRSLVKTYGSFVSGLPQPERKFDLRYIKPRNFNSILKNAKNIVIAFTLDRKSVDSDILKKNFNEESLTRIENDTSLFYYTRRNQYANGQVILYLFGNNEQQLISKINKNQNFLLNFFEDEVKKRVSRDIFKKLENNLSKKIYEDHKIKIKIPYGYDLAKNIKDSNGNFFWLRQLELDYEKNIFVYYENYEKNKLANFYKIFNDENKSIVQLRDKISKIYLKDSENKNVYMTLQDVYPIQYQNIVFKDNIGVEAFGLWKLSDISAGGPFKTFVIYDKNKKRAYYIEGYVFAPGQKKRDLMLEINSILNTFEI